MSGTVLKPTYHITVRELAEFCFRRGDLNRVGISSTAMQKGIEVHRNVQKSRGENYRAEFPVSRQVQRSDYNLLISGRIDGVFFFSKCVRIEEIKSVTVSLEDLASDTYPAHWAQLKIYGTFFSTMKNLGRLELQLTYYQTDTGEIREFMESFTATELEHTFETMIAFYSRWLDRILCHQKNRAATLGSLTFPFKKYRQGQSALVDEVEKTIAEGGHMLVEAPTGLGKTMAVLYPAVKSLAGSRADKIFFLTARTPGRRAAQTALTALNPQDSPHLKWISLIAREKICFQPDASCTAEQCEYARNFYDRINSALDECYSAGAFTQTLVEETARHYRVCPFELTLELSIFADVIICDYNYVFDPRVVLRRFFLRKNLLNGGDRYIFLVDEAHNLPDRARGMYSATLNKRDFLKLKQTLKKSRPSLGKAAGRINAWFIRSQKELEYTGSNGAQEEFPAGLVPELKAFLDSCERFFRESPRNEFSDEVFKLYNDVVRFMVTAENYDEHYATCFEKTQRGLEVRLFCMDPSDQLKTCLTRAVASVFLSATLNPIGYFRRLLGCHTSARVLSLSSPYPSENRLVVQMEGLSVRYRHRRETIGSVVKALSVFIAARSGNYMIYFPSYAYLESIRTELLRSNPEMKLLVQTPGMTEDQRFQFLEKFDLNRGQTLVGMAVMGGIFSESIDLSGESLTGVGILGVGLPAVTLERELIKYHFDEAGAGYDFAYLYPGLSRIVQAAGRLIRSENDRGALLLIDDRFTSDRYAELLPDGWHVQSVKDIPQLWQTLEAFWHE